MPSLTVNPGRTPFPSSSSFAPANTVILPSHDVSKEAKPLSGPSVDNSTPIDSQLKLTLSGPAPNSTPAPLRPGGQLGGSSPSGPFSGRSSFAAPGFGGIV